MSAPVFLMFVGTGLLFEVPNPAAGKIVYTSRSSTGKPNPRNDYIYRFHASASLIFLSQFEGEEGDKG
jgi:hypothetical protein